MLKTPVAYAQTGIEALRWLGSEPYTEARARDQARSLHLGVAALTVAGRVCGKFPEFGAHQLARRIVRPEHELVGVGTESVVLHADGNVEKYLTGKSQNAFTLARRLQGYHKIVQEYLGPYVPETTVDVCRTRLFRFLPAEWYVRIRQPKVDFDKVDPHGDADFMADNPKAQAQIEDLASRLCDMYLDHGLLMDVVNRGNFVWDSKAEQLSMLDTVPVDIAERDFSGIHLPLWTPQLYLEALAEFFEHNVPNGLVVQSDDRPSLARA